MGARIRGTIGDIDPLNKAPFKRATSRVQKGPPLRGLPSDLGNKTHVQQQSTKPYGSPAERSLLAKSTNSKATRTVFTHPK